MVPLDIHLSVNFDTTMEEIFLFSWTRYGASRILLPLLVRRQSLIL